MLDLGTYVRQGQSTLRRWALDPRAHTAVRVGTYVLAGFFLSAASLANNPLPLAMGLAGACTGWSAVLVTLGGLAGYWAFWGGAGQLCCGWLLSCLVITLLLADRRLTRSAPLLLPALSGLQVAVWGLVGQYMGISPALPVYLLQVCLSAATVWLFARVLEGRNPILDWLACGFGVLALAQVMPIPYLGFGYIAVGALVGIAAFPAAVLGGLALDLAQITPLPMTAVAALSYLVRFLPRCPAAVRRLAPGTVFILLMYLCAQFDLQPLPGLLLGGLLSALLPSPRKATHRRGETGVAQVRLELAAGVFHQTQQLLMEAPTPPVDEDALVSRAADRACSGCSNRKNCRDTRRLGQLPGALLHKPLLNTDELPIICRKSGRFLAELHRSQEQMRSIRADRERQREYRAALVQQYGFLSEFLQDLSDQLARRTSNVQPCYQVQISVFGNRPEADNGDRCLRFSGTGCRYYVLLCDGMGTGLGAVQDGRTAGALLRRLLSAGYPARYALRSLNSLCALRDRAGAVTVDLAEIELDSGKVTLYKWGAAPSYLLGQSGMEKIGIVTPPPGLSVTDFQETTHRLALRREQLLVLVSDGVPEEEALRCCTQGLHLSPAELATELLSFSRIEGQDDATVVTLRLQAKQ